MTRRVAWLVHAATALAGVTGAVLVWMCWFTEAADEFAIVNHPWQPVIQHLHLLLAPLLVFVIGLIWQGHAWQKIRTGARDRRVSGLFLACLALPMIVSGYAIQVVTDEDWRAFWSIGHAIAASAWTLVYLLHQLQRRGRRPAARRSATA